MVPHLTTALNGPLLALESKLLNATPDIERWLRGQWQEHTPPFYGSVDLRNSGFKLAPVDMNLFPGGFNNLNSAFLPLCVQAAMSAIDKICPSAKNLLLIPENHTRNFFYLQNVAQLAITVRSDKTWTPPIPFVSVDRVGARWVVTWPGGKLGASGRAGADVECGAFARISGVDAVPKGDLQPMVS